MVSFWIDYGGYMLDESLDITHIDLGTNYIGGTGETQSEAAWRIPLALQLVPALILGVGVIFIDRKPSLFCQCYLRR